MEKISIRLDQIEKELLRECAEEQGIAISQIIRRLVKEYLDEYFER